MPAVGSNAPKARLSGTWKSWSDVWGKHGGSWKKPIQVYAKSGGTWKEVWNARPIVSGVTWSSGYNSNLGIWLTSFSASVNANGYSTTVTSTVSGGGSSGWVTPTTVSSSATAESIGGTVGSDSGVVLTVVVSNAYGSETYTYTV